MNVEKLFKGVDDKSIFLLKKDLKRIRDYLVRIYPQNEFLEGCCVEASQMVMGMLITKYYIEADYIDGYIYCREYFDDTDEDTKVYSKHCWIEMEFCDKRYIVDTTLSQFNEKLDNPVDDVFIVPVKDKPSFIRYYIPREGE